MISKKIVMWGLPTLFSIVLLIGFYASIQSNFPDPLDIPVVPNFVPWIFHVVLWGFVFLFWAGFVLFGILLDVKSSLDELVWINEQPLIEQRRKQAPSVVLVKKKPLARKKSKKKAPKKEGSRNKIADLAREKFHGEVPVATVDPQEKPEESVEDQAPPEWREEEFE